jgi:hypothetical protein
MICIENNITLNVNWIPRDLNIVADAISNSLDYTDYFVTQDFFNMVAKDFERKPVIDLFANEYNTKCKKYFSLTFTKNACGVDAFCYNWKLYGLGWIFVPPPMILRAIHHLQVTESEAFILVPQWKTSSFYPRLTFLKQSVAFKRMIVYDGKNIFRQGLDLRTYFGPDFQANVEIWHLDFSV